MNVVPKFLSRKGAFASLGVVALFIGLAMLHPYPRQSLFGPTIRGKPRCFWEAEIQRHLPREPSFVDRAKNVLGMPRRNMPWQEVFDDAEMLPLLLDMLDDPDNEVRHFALGNLTIFRSLQQETALPALRQQLAAGDLECQLLAARAIWSIAKDEAAIGVLLKPLDDADPGVRALAMSHVANLAGEAPQLYPHIVARVKDPNPRVRVPVMYAMTQFGEKGVPVLIDGLNDPSAEVRIAAAIATDNLGPVAKDAAPALEARLTDSDPDIRTVAAAALLRIDRERYQHLKELPR